MGRQVQRTGVELFLRDNLTPKIKKATSAVKGFASRGKKGLKSFGKGMIALNQGVELLKTAFRALVMPIVNAMKAGVDEARKFERAINEVWTLVDDKGVGAAKRLASEVTNLATSFGKMPVEEAKGMYMAISAGATGAGEAIRVMNAANKLAIGGVTSVNKGVDALTTVINAYGVGFDRSEQVSDKFFQTIRMGKTTAEELSQSIGQVVSQAAYAGLSMDEMFTVIAAGTKVGQSTAMATVGLNAAITAMIKPTKQSREEAKRLGIDFSVSALKSKGFIGVLKSISSNAKTNDKTLANLFGSVRALRIVTGVMSNNFKEFDNILPMMNNSLGATNEAFRKMTSSMDHQISITEALGKTTQVSLGKAVMKTETFQNSIQQLQEAFKDFTKWLGSAEGQGALEGFFETFRFGLMMMLQSFRNVITVFMPAAILTGNAKNLTALRKGLDSALKRMAMSANKQVTLQGDTQGELLDILAKNIKERLQIEKDHDDMSAEAAKYGSKAQLSMLASQYHKETVIELANRKKQEASFVHYLKTRHNMTKAAIKKEIELRLKPMTTKGQTGKIDAKRDLDPGRDKKDKKVAKEQRDLAREFFFGIVEDQRAAIIQFREQATMLVPVKALAKFQKVYGEVSRTLEEVPRFDEDELTLARPDETKAALAKTVEYFNQSRNDMADIERRLQQFLILNDEKTNAIKIKQLRAALVDYVNEYKKADNKRTTLIQKYNNKFEETKAKNEAKRRSDAFKRAKHMAGLEDKAKKKAQTKRDKEMDEITATAEAYASTVTSVMTSFTDDLFDSTVTLGDAFSNLFGNLLDMIQNALSEFLIAEGIKQFLVAQTAGVAVAANATKSASDTANMVSTVGKESVKGAAAAAASQGKFGWVGLITAGIIASLFISMIKGLMTEASGGKGYALGGLVKRYASGGPVFKSMGTDTVPAMLTPGEWVMPKPIVDSIRQGRSPSSGGYAAGGLVPAASGAQAPIIQVQTFAVPNKAQFRRWYKDTVQPNRRALARRGQI